jgi:hypothetical protein
METNNLIGSLSLNDMVLKYLRSIRPHTAVFALWNSVPDAHLNCGCHPDIVEWLWVTVGKTLPKDCRCLIHRCPALVHPESGVIFAIAMGMEHGLRVPQILHTDAIAAGATTIHNWSAGDSTDIRLELGDEWFFGFGGPAEIALIGLAYAAYGPKEKKHGRD